MPDGLMGGLFRVVISILLLFLVYVVRHNIPLKNQKFAEANIRDKVTISSIYIAYVIAGLMVFQAAGGVVYSLTSS